MNDDWDALMDDTTTLDDIWTLVTKGDGEIYDNIDTIGEDLHALKAELRELRASLDKVNKKLRPLSFKTREEAIRRANAILNQSPIFGDLCFDYDT
ncbi:hypothetical protein IWW39_002410, partial [Coemansia spiralis]